MSDNFGQDILACFGAILLSVILTPLLAIYQGWILTVLWGWFIAPIFHLPELSIVMAIGLTLVASMFKSYTYTKKVELSDKEKLTQALTIVLIPLVILSFGWIVHFFV